MASTIKYPISLQAQLEKLLGSRNVYFQPPSDFKMKYPCIVYQLDNIDTRYADNRDFMSYKRYQLTYIDPNPDTTVPDRLNEVPLCSFVRFFTSENRNHYIFRIYHKEVYHNG